MNVKNLFFNTFFTIILLSIGAFSHAQFTTNTNQTFLAAGSFIENKGQYGTTYKGQESLGEIIYGYEGHSMPILFTKKGMIILQRKVTSLSHKEKEKQEKQGLSEEVIEQKKIVTDRAITMEWLGANADLEIIEESKTNNYYTYGLIKEKAYGYKKIIYKNLYNGIDLVYSFTSNSKIGFEYSLNVAAGADISQIKMQYAGDVKKIKTNRQGNLIIESDIEGIQQSTPITFYNQTSNEQQTPSISSYNKQLGPKTYYKITNNQVNFALNETYDNTKPITIDPFISSTSNLDGANAGKAKDVDFDYAGNVYVTGGGDVVSNHRLAKYNSAGVLQWTFNGVLTIPSWQFGRQMGGWVVEKNTGNIYLGQGLPGISLIRLTTNGIYDNFITDPEPLFVENWKLFWKCNNGDPQIYIAGGSYTSNTNIGIITPSSNTISIANITGLATTNQDIVDIVLDQNNGDIYSILNSRISPANIDNIIYKNAYPYSASSILWNQPSGLTTFVETKNRPYLVPTPSEFSENSANVFALNANYLFYWDGNTLIAFNRNTGAIVGTPITTSNPEKMCGGIYVDAANNIWVGNLNGTIQAYYFTGTTFLAGYAIDNPLNDPTIPFGFIIPGYETKSVYDLAYNASNNLLYASGDGFVAALNIRLYNPNTNYTINISPNCQTASIAASLTPTPPATSVVTYTLYIGNTQIASNTTGIFTNLLPLTNYTMIATLNAVCSGDQITKNFTVVGPSIATTPTNEICGNGSGQIVALGSGTVAPYTYSINGTNFFASGTFAGLSSGTYNITVKDGNGCINTKQVVVANVSFTPTILTNYSGTTCGNSTGTINATANGGVGPYQYSINNGANYQLSNIFAGLSAGQYQVKVKDVNGCLSTTVLVDITPSFGVGIIALPTNSTCGFANGIITANPIGGVAPFQYSINGGTTYQTSNIFTGLLAGLYTINIKDGNNCLNTSQQITVSNTAGANVTATSANATCGFANGKITATAIGGTPPFQYSINGGTTFQSFNVFTNLAPTNYTVTIKDATGCINNTTISVSNTPIPILQVFAGRDTSVVIFQPLQLNALDINNTGFVSYTWSPTFGLNRPDIKAPTAILDKDFAYEVIATTADGCIATDSIKIKVTYTSEIYVPSAFTPNGDGKNDVLRPKLIGIKELKYFAIYNRYGVLIYKSNNENQGWDGFIKGAAQNTGTFVWMAEGVDYLGRTIFRKGTSMLIR